MNLGLEGDSLDDGVPREQVIPTEGFAATMAGPKHLAPSDVVSKAERFAAELADKTEAQAMATVLSAMAEGARLVNEAEAEASSLVERVPKSPRGDVDALCATIDALAASNNGLVDELLRLRAALMRDGDHTEGPSASL